MPTKEEHEESKRIIEAYRHVAKKIYQDMESYPLEIDLKMDIKIPQRANVQQVEDGAFVEAIVFVPKEWLTGEKK